MLFPELAPGYDYQMTQVFNVLRLGPTENNLIQRRVKGAGLYQFELKYKKSSGVLAQLMSFFDSCQGGFLDFAFFDFLTTRVWGNLAIGTGTGSQTVFELRGKNTSNRTIRVAGVAKEEGADYILSANAGTDGQDRIEFVIAPPANAALITAAYTGRRYFPRCIFMENSLTTALSSNTRASLTLKIMEVAA